MILPCCSGKAAGIVTATEFACGFDGVSTETVTGDARLKFNCGRKCVFLPSFDTMGTEAAMLEGEDWLASSFDGWIG